VFGAAWATVYDFFIVGLKNSLLGQSLFVMIVISAHKGLNQVQVEHTINLKIRSGDNVTCAD
jgi:hypothetical protein